MASTVIPAVMNATQFSYPYPDKFAEGPGACSVAPWIKADRQPYWYRPATLALAAPLDRPGTDDRSQEGFVEGMARANLLRHEMALFARAHGVPAGVAEMYWSEGVAGLPEPALRSIRAAVAHYFDVQADARFTAHVGTLSKARLRLPVLRDLGVTTLRASVAADRAWDWESVESFFAQARSAGFRTIGVDLPVYAQNISMRAMRERVAGLAVCRPSRILLCPAGHGDASDDRTSVQRIRQATFATLIAAGYEYVAYDAFALHHDELVNAKRVATLVPRYYGYSGCTSYVSIAIGQGAVGNVGPMQYQNCREAQSYIAMLERETLPVERALLSTRDDLARRSIMTALLVNFSVDIESIEQSYGIDFDTAFREELLALEPLMGEGLVEKGRNHLTLTSIGRFACDRVVDVFDRGLRRPQSARRAPDGR